VGLRTLELLCFREKGCKKEKSVIQILNFIRTVVWKSLFGRPADDLQISHSKKNEYYIYDEEPIICKYISQPNSERCAKFAAGIINGILDGAEFPCEVNAVRSKEKVVFVISFSQKVIARENS